MASAQLTAARTKTNLLSSSTSRAISIKQTNETDRHVGVPRDYWQPLQSDSEKTCLFRCFAMASHLLSSRDSPHLHFKSPWEESLGSCNCIAVSSYLGMSSPLG